MVDDTATTRFADPVGFTGAAMTRRRNPRSELFTIYLFPGHPATPSTKYDDQVHDKLGKQSFPDQQRRLPKVYYMTHKVQGREMESEFK